MNPDLAQRHVFAAIGDQMILDTEPQRVGGCYQPFRNGNVFTRWGRVAAGMIVGDDDPGIILARGFADLAQKPDDLAGLDNRRVA